MTFEILFILKSRKSTLKPLANRLAWVRPQGPVGPQVVMISPDWGNRHPIQPHADPKSEVPTAAGPKHLQTGRCRFGKHWGHTSRVWGWQGTKMLTEGAAVCSHLCWAVLTGGARSFSMCWKVSLRPHSASPLRTQGPDRPAEQYGLLWAMPYGLIDVRLCYFFMENASMLVLWAAVAEPEH